MRPRRRACRLPMRSAVDRKHIAECFCLFAAVHEYTELLVWAIVSRSYLNAVTVGNSAVICDAENHMTRSVVADCPGNNL